MDLQELNNLLEDQITQLRATHLVLHNMQVDMRIRNGLLLADVSGYMGGPTSPQTKGLSDTLSRLQRVTRQVYFMSIAFDTEGKLHSRRKRRKECVKDA